MKLPRQPAIKMTCPCPKHPFGCFDHPTNCGCGVVTSHVTLNCDYGSAPDEQTVDLMYRALEMRAGKEFVAERVFWGPAPEGDRQFFFAIYRD